MNLLLLTAPLANPAISLPLADLLRHKKLWLRVNRALAWTLVISPVLQILLDSRLLPGLLLDLAILLVHGALSLWLFGLPKAKPGSTASEAAWMRWAGMSEHGMSSRNRFLLSGWRIVLSSAYLTALPFVAALGFALSFYPLAAVALVIAGIFVVITFNFYSLMWPYAVLTHTYGASRYALHRWGMTGIAANTLACAVALLVMLGNAINLLRPLWSAT